MLLKLHERRTGTHLVRIKRQLKENTCVFCDGVGIIEHVGPMTDNVHGLRDDHDKPMRDQQVSCIKCGATWFDVFCRIYK